MSISLAVHEVIVRHVGAMAFDSATGVVDGSAFDRTRKDDDGVSVNRRGVFAADTETDRAAIRAIVATRRKVGTRSVFAEIGVGDLLDALKEFDTDIDVIADPLSADGDAPPNPAHALVLGLPFAGESTGSLRSEVAGDRIRQRIRHVFPASV